MQHGFQKRMEKRLFAAHRCRFRTTLESRMASYQWGSTDCLPLAEIDLDFHRYRLVHRQAEETMVQSLRRYGQLSPIVVCATEGRLLLLDGFKRHAAAGRVKGMDTLWSRRLEADAAAAKAALYTLNSLARPVQALEEAWIVHALIREDGLSQPAVAELLGRHKSWVCRRLALLERLAPEVREDLGLGLVSPTAARQLTRLPAGNQLKALETVRRESLTAAELRGVVDLLLASGTQEKQRYVLEKPRQALREFEGHVSRSWDPRMSAAGNHISRRLAKLLDLLAGLESWLRYSGRGVLELRDREPLRPGIERLLLDCRGVAELTEDFLRELHLP
jgi:ParB-like chromosome segregation protein Spo0J